MLLLPGLLAAASAAAAVPPPRVRLFTDPRLANLSAASGWAVAVGPVSKDAANPLLAEDKIWDVRWDNTYITARHDSATGKFRMWYNGFVSCGGYSQGADEPGTKNACGHPEWHRSFGKAGLIPWPNSPGRPMSALMYAESTDGVKFTKVMQDLVAYPWNGTNNTPVSPTNILMMGEAASGTGILYDEHERNASRRYKAMGSFWNYLHCGKRPTHAVHGTKWPPCQCLGASFSADGVHWDGPLADESKQNGGKGNLPGLNAVGQDDGALDLAIWDDDLDGGSYWGLVRVDATGKNHRRTGRWTSKDFKSFTAAEQVFQGTGDDDQVYTVQPFRLAQWPAGQYLATAMFFAQNEKQGWVRCELIQSLDFGQNWTRLAPGQQFIPLGHATDFDSHTLYTAWSGGQAPLLNPRNASETMFYYAGGDGPHTGQRDDSIGLARAVTHAYAGLRVAAGATATVSRLTTGPIDDLHVPAGGLSILAGLGAGARVRVGLATASGQQSDLVDLAAPGATAPADGPQWLSIPASIVLAWHKQRLVATASKDDASRLVIEAEGATMLFALRSDAPST